MIEIKANTSLNLRTMTLKSKVGFGHLKNFMIGELIQMNRSKELLNYYYNLGMVNFNQEVKDLLCITPSREIPKPGKLPKEEASKKVYLCYRDILDKLTDIQRIKDISVVRRQLKDEKKAKSIGTSNVFNSKELLQGKNHGR